MLRVVVFDIQWTIKMYHFINFVISLSIFTILAALQTGMNAPQKMSRFYPKCMLTSLDKLKSLKQHIKNGQNQAIQFITSEM